MSRPDFGTVICGGGPAGLGPILAAGIAGRLPALLADGVRVVERSDRLGPGALARYVVGSNSLGRAFLEVLEDSDEGYLDPAGNSAAAAELRRRAGAYPPLRRSTRPSRTSTPSNPECMCAADRPPACSVMSRRPSVYLPAASGGRSPVA